jgi:hypothetical protein
MDEGASRKQHTIALRRKERLCSLAGLACAGARKRTTTDSMHAARTYSSCEGLDLVHKIAREFVQFADDG